MGSEKTLEVTLAEAKENLRASAKRASPAAWVAENPGEALAYAFFAGLASGSSEKKLLPVIGLVSKVFEVAAANKRESGSEKPPCR